MTSPFTSLLIRFVRVRLSVPLTISIPPPARAALLNASCELVNAMLPLCMKTPPPLPLAAVARLLVMVDDVILRLPPATKIAPPFSARLLWKIVFARRTVEPSPILSPPPSVDWPFRMTKLEIDTPDVLLATLKTRWACPSMTMGGEAASPRSTESEICNEPRELKAMTWPLSEAANRMESTTPGPVPP